MSYQSVTWVVFDASGNLVVGVDPPYPSKASRVANPVFRRGKGLKFINATHVVGLLGSAVQPPYADYRAFIWDMETNDIALYRVHSHHDVEYNPHTKTFLTLTNVPTPYGFSVEHIHEVDGSGRTVHHWNGSQWFEYIREHEELRKLWDRCHGYECKDKIHGNTLAWDWEHGFVYINSRHLDSFFKVQWNSETNEFGRIIWGVGRVGHFKLFNQKKKRVPSIVYHAHQLNILGDGKFLLFNNGQMNTFSSCVIVQVDEGLEEAQVVWRYEYPHQLYQPAMGGVIRTPTNNVLAALGYGCFLNEFNTVKPGNASLIEVTPDKKIAWQVHFAPGEQHGWMYYRAERFYANPIITLRNTTVVCHRGGPCLVEAAVWNSFYTIHETSGFIYLVSLGHQVLSRQPVVFVPYWLPTNVTVPINCLRESGATSYRIVIENSEGFSSGQEVVVHGPTGANDCSPLCS